MGGQADKSKLRTYSLLCFGCAMTILSFTGMCLYDAMVAYPDQIERYQALQQVQQNSPDDWRSAWHAKAMRNGWASYEIPPETTESDITAQYILAAVSGVIGLGLLVVMLALLLKSRSAPEAEPFGGGIPAMYMNTPTDDAGELAQPSIIEDQPRE